MDKEIKRKIDLKDFKAVNIFMEEAEVDNFNTLRVTKDPKIVENDEATYAKLIDSDFKNGTISVKVLSRLLPDAPSHARGFIGLAFHINETDNQFESIYIRPTNGRANIQLRRNHSVQYFSYPDFKFDRLRKENPEEYETYADMGLNEWIDMKIVVIDEQAKLYLNHSKQPTLIVNDLKLGSKNNGAIGLWVDIGTEGFFRDLVISDK